MKSVLARYQYLIFLWIFSMNTQATNLEIQCSLYFEEIKDDQRFPTIESKLKFFLAHKEKCGGTGLYDSRLSYLYAQIGDIPSAREALKKGLSTKNEYHTSLKYSMVDLWVQEGELDKAYQAAKQLVAEHGDWHGGYMLLAKITLMQQKFSESINYGKKANSLEPSAGVYVGQTIAYHQLDQHEEAVSAMMEAIKLDSRVLGSNSGTNEAIYSLVSLNNLKGASEMAHGRMLSDPHWDEDTTFIKAVNYLRSNGFLNED